MLCRMFCEIYASTYAEYCAHVMSDYITYCLPKCDEHP